MSLNTQPLECRKLTAEYKQPLTDFLHALQEAGDDKYFYPHPFTEGVVDRLTRYDGKDLYYVLVEGEGILGYAMLRGWDEGFEIPSLGIAIHPLARNTGLGKVFMHFLHAAARRKGATKVRLRVHPDNIKAVKLYKTLGYKFQSQEAEYLVGILDLG